MKDSIDKHFRVALTHLEEALEEIDELEGDAWPRLRKESLSYEVQQAVRAVGYARTKLARKS